MIIQEFLFAILIALIITMVFGIYREYYWSFIKRNNNVEDENKNLTAQIT